MTSSLQEGVASPAPSPSKADVGGEARLGYEIHAVQIDHEVVVLDLRRDLYLCIPRPQQGEGAEGRRLAEILRNAGVRTQDPSARSPYHPLPKPTDDTGEDVDAAISWRDAWDAAIATLDLYLNYYGRSLSALIAFLEEEATCSPLHVDETAARILARRFHRWIPLAPVSSKCLVRSFMLLRYLRRHGLAADWAFGVRTWPFRAHCWIQLGNLALDEAPERLVTYAPLMTVRS